MSTSSIREYSVFMEVRSEWRANNSCRGRPDMPPLDKESAAHGTVCDVTDAFGGEEEINLERRMGSAR